jgi:WhiB family redox-sensing transcriptional regulator
VAKPPETPLPHWAEKGACRRLSPDIFFDDTDGDFPNITAATACGHCMIQLECLNWAMRTKEKYGIWGGTTPRQREKLRRVIPRSHCPGCQSNAIMEEPTSETCLSCGLSWKI